MSNEYLLRLLWAVAGFTCCLLFVNYSRPVELDETQLLAQINAALPSREQAAGEIATLRQQLQAALIAKSASPSANAGVDTVNFNASAGNAPMSDEEMKRRKAAITERE